MFTVPGISTPTFKQNSWHFANNIFYYIFLKEKHMYLYQIVCEMCL